MTTETEMVSGRLGAACPSWRSCLQHLDCLLKRSQKRHYGCPQMLTTHTAWSTQRQGELDLISVKISEVYPFGSQGLASISKIQQSFPEQPRGQSIHCHQPMTPTPEMLYGNHRTYLTWVTGDKYGKAVCSLLSPQSKSPHAQAAVLLGQPEMVVGNGGDARDVAMSRRAR